MGACVISVTLTNDEGTPHRNGNLSNVGNARPKNPLTLVISVVKYGQYTERSTFGLANILWRAVAFIDLKRKPVVPIFVCFTSSSATSEL